MDEDVSSIVENRVFPILAPDGDGDNPIKYPLIIIKRSSLEPFYTKTSAAPSQDTASVTIDCWTPEYHDSIELAEYVRQAMEFSKGEIGGVKVDRVRLIDADEGYSENAFYQRLIFSFK